MNIRKLFLLVLILLFGTTNGIHAQVTVTAASGQSVRTLLEQNFLGSGVVLDTTKPILFNGQPIINSNQIGTFINGNTSGNNMPIDKGIVLVTGNCQDAAASSNSSAVCSSTSSPASNGPSVSELLYATYVQEGGSSSMNDVACLTFWVIPKSTSEEMTFKYSFASEEYPQYVCSNFNDIFGLFVDGPYEPDQMQYANVSARTYRTYNVAVLEDGTRVTINKVNNGQIGSAGNQGDHCDLSHSMYHRMNDNNNCRFNGYTVELTTETMEVVPCKSYKLEIAIADIGDAAYNSAVFLKAGSLTSHTKTLSHHPNKGNDMSLKYFVKGCSNDTITLTSNYIATAEESLYAMTLVSSNNGQALQRGVDYEVEDPETGEAASLQIKIPEGDTIKNLILRFMHNEEKPRGTTDTLYLISVDYGYSCMPPDTITYILREPDSMIASVSGGKIYCEDRLPMKDTVIIGVDNAQTYAVITATKGYNNSELFFQDTLRYITNQTVRTLKDSVMIITADINDTNTVFINITDSCGNSFDTLITYRVLSNEASITANKRFICQGDSIRLLATEFHLYEWSSNPFDSTLLKDGRNYDRSPVVSPIRNTLYTVVTTSEEGCLAQDTFSIKVEQQIQARMNIRPRQTSFSKPDIYYEDMTNGELSRQWDFGNGVTSSDIAGYITYAYEGEAAQYEIILIARGEICTDTIRDTVTLVPDFVLFVPDAFIPESNNPATQYFMPIGAFLEYYELNIYNRWGGKIFSSVNQPWDGKLESGQYAPQGTYVYDIYYHDGGGRLQRKTGTVILLPNTGEK